MAASKKPWLGTRIVGSIIKELPRGFIRNAASWSANMVGMGGYNATDPRRKIILRGQRPARATANELAMASLNILRNHARHLERNNPTMRAAVDGLVALVVGSGIALEPDTGDEATDDRLRAVWQEYHQCVTVDGRDLYHLQDQGFREVVVAGELIWREVILPERVDAGDIPLAILPLEGEWLDDVTAGSIVYLPGPDGTVRVGSVTLDRYGRAIKYRIRNPEYNSLWPAEELPAAALIHVFERRRSIQARGEPWAAPIIERLQQDGDLVDTELQAAITASAIGIAITSEVHDPLDTGDNNDASEPAGYEDDPAQSLRLGGVARLFPGEDIKAFSHDRPSQQIAPFRQGIRGDIAAALRCPQRFLDRDVSRANYSSMRADMLDTERILGPVREWYGHATAGRIYRDVLPYLCAKAGVPFKKRYAKYRLVPDGQAYVDPQKDVQAAIMAISAGLSTWEKEAGKRGDDAKKLREQLSKELKDPLLKAIFDVNLGFGSGSESGDAKTDDKAKKDNKKKDDAVNADDRAAMVSGMRSIADSIIASQRQSASPSVTLVNETRIDERSAEVMGRAIAANQKPAIVNVAAAESPIINVAAPSVTVRAAEVSVPQANVVVNVPQQPAPVVNVSAPDVRIDNHVEVPQRTIRAMPQRDGSVIMEPQK